MARLQSECVVKAAPWVRIPLSPPKYTKPDSFESGFVIPVLNNEPVYALEFLNIVGDQGLLGCARAEAAINTS